jgi:hypothetical protein
MALQQLHSEPSLDLLFRAVGLLFSSRQWRTELNGEYHQALILASGSRTGRWLSTRRTFVPSQVIVWLKAPVPTNLASSTEPGKSLVQRSQSTSWLSAFGLNQTLANYSASRSAGYNNTLT